MGMSDAVRSAGGAFRATGRAGGRVARRAGRLVHRVTGAQGADRTGLSTLIEMTAVSGMGDAFVTVALAGSIFFNTSLNQARGSVVLYLLITMAPFALVAPFIGPALDRVQQGRKLVLAGTMLTRGLLCFAMSANVASPATLLPAAFGVLVLQKAGGVVKAAVTPRLLPQEITLVKANARSGLISIIASTVAAVLAAGVQLAGGAAWTLRVGMVIYLLSMILAFRLPAEIDVPVAPPVPEPAPAPGPGPFPGPSPAAPGMAPTRADMPSAWAGAPSPGSGGPTRPDLPPAQAGQDRPRPTLPLPPPGPGQDPPGAQEAPAPPPRGRRGHWRTLSTVGPVVAEAMTINAVLRAFSGYVLFLLAFLLRSVHLGTLFGHPVSPDLALGALAVGLSAGSLAAMGVASFLRDRAPQVIMFAVLLIAPLVAAACAWGFGLLAAVLVEAVAIFCASLAKLGQDAIVGREIGDEIRSSTYAASESLNQVANVAGGLAGVLASMLDNGQVGLGIAAGGLFVALVLITGRCRRARVGAVRPRVT
jgi:hypothetical protein